MGVANVIYKMPLMIHDYRNTGHGLYSERILAVEL